MQQKYFWMLIKVSIVSGVTDCFSNWDPFFRTRSTYLVLKSYLTRHFTVKYGSAISSFHTIAAGVPSAWYSASPLYYLLFRHFNSYVCWWYCYFGKPQKWYHGHTNTTTLFKSHTTLKHVHNVESITQYWQMPAHHIQPPPPNMPSSLQNYFTEYFTKSNLQN